MKSKILKLALCLTASMLMTFAACQKEEPAIADTTTDTVGQGQEGGQEGGGNDTIQASIIGKWMLIKATQYIPGNEVDMTPIYGEYCYITFEEGGNLIYENNLSSTNMEWTLEGDQLAFIQASNPTMYVVKTLTDTDLVIEHGAGTENVTVMELQRT